MIDNGTIKNIIPHPQSPLPRYPTPTGRGRQPSQPFQDEHIWGSVEGEVLPADVAAVQDAPRERKIDGSFRCFLPLFQAHSNRGRMQRGRWPLDAANRPCEDAEPVKSPACQPALERDE
jgi:hypothetical protein